MTKLPEGFWGKIERSAYQRVEMGVNSAFFGLVAAAGVLC
jgi:hypothetical protein